MATIDLSTCCQFLTSPRIPPELVLKTVQHLPFNNGNLIASLRHAHPRLWELFKNYERSITCSFIMKDLRHAQTDFSCDGFPSIAWLSRCVQGYDTVDDVMDALCSDTNLNPVARHNQSLANAGLLLLYRLVSVGRHADRLAYVKSLPRDPLIAIYLVLHHATLAARYHGTGWVNQRTYGGRFMDANQLSLRNELEFCFAEAVLCTGPRYIFDTLLRHNADAETTLLNFYHDHGIHDWDWPCWGTGKGEFEPPRTQGPHREPGKGRSLFTMLLERLSGLMDCTLEEVRQRVEQDMAAGSHSLAHLDLEGKARLMQGLDLEHVDGKFD
ncbi:hypothetical protein EJ02DRAFT_257338 [Clathrospora elynae]|uniref:Uncharacterized protein n=1 Tax=Clathrospora elynae TaxID=706981 RepID=A0A6A5SI55_9PLEO|nr:hypothetical protein EJ02DRAFT_257338 [Clathrospora elynae]